MGTQNLTFTTSPGGKDFDRQVQRQPDTVPYVDDLMFIYLNHGRLRLDLCVSLRPFLQPFMPPVVVEKAFQETLLK